MAIIDSMAMEAGSRTGRVVDISSLAKLGFWIATAATLAVTLLPARFMVHSVALPLSDKAEHAIAFFTLALLGLAGWGFRRAIVLCASLAVLGGMIELLQSTAFIGRDAETLDWVADTAGMTPALLLFLLVRFIAFDAVRPYWRRNV